MQNSEALCVCGCGQPVSRALQNFPERGYKKGDYFRYARGHRGKHPAWNKGHWSEVVNEFSARVRARGIKGPGLCELVRIGGCSPRLHVHHIDGNPFNNDPANLMRLCMSHHALVERDRIDLDNPVMPPFTISSGKRRYRYG